MAIIKTNDLTGISQELLEELITLRNQKQGNSLKIITDHLLNGITVVEAARNLGIKDTTTASATLKSLITIHNRAIDYALSTVGKVEDDLSGITQEQWDALIVLRNQRKGRSTDIVHKVVFEKLTITEASKALGVKDVSTASKTVKSIQLCHKRAINYAENFLNFKLVDNTLAINGVSPDLGLDDNSFQVLLQINKEVKEYKEKYSKTPLLRVDGSETIDEDRFNTLARMYLVERINLENLAGDWNVVAESASQKIRTALTQVHDFITGKMMKESSDEQEAPTLRSTAKQLLDELVNLDGAAVKY